MIRKTNRVALVLAGLAVLLIAASLGSYRFTGLLAPAAHAAQAAQPTATPVQVSSRGGGVVEVLPAEGAQAPTAVPAATSTGSVLPETGQGASANTNLLLGAAGVLAVLAIVLGLWLASGRRRGPTG